MLEQSWQNSTILGWREEKAKPRCFVLSIDCLINFGFLSIVITISCRYTQMSSKESENAGASWQNSTILGWGRERQKLSSFRLTNGYRRGLSSIDFLLFPRPFSSVFFDEKREVDFFFNLTKNLLAPSFRVEGDTKQNRISTNLGLCSPFMLLQHGFNLITV